MDFNVETSDAEAAIEGRKNRGLIYGGYDRKIEDRHLPTQHSIHLADIEALGLLHCRWGGQGRDGGREGQGGRIEWQ